LPPVIDEIGLWDCVSRHYQGVEKRHERRQGKAKSDEKAQFICNK